MSEVVVRCKRCNRVLTNKESIKRGYGKTCYRIIQLQEQNKPNEELIDLRNKWNQLSLKFTVLERKLKKLEKNGVGVQNIEPIERIRKNQHRPEQNQFKVNLT